MCNDVATKDDQYISARDARNAYFANMFNVHFEHETIRCHLVAKHGPHLTRADMEGILSEMAAKFGRENPRNSKFYSERALWGARHHCCAMHGEDLADRAQTAKNGDRASFTVDCSHLDTVIGMALDRNGVEFHIVDKVDMVFVFQDGKWYEFTGYPNPEV